MKVWNNVVVAAFAVSFTVFLCKTLLAGEVGQASSPDMMNVPYSQGIRNVVMTSRDACPTMAVTAGGVEERNPTNHPEQKNTGKPTKEEVIQKTRTLQVPFIANNGQVDEQVTFYAKTFGGTVFVTKEGAIVYSLPDGRGVETSPPGRLRLSRMQGALGSSGAAGWHGQAPLIRAESEFAVNGYLPLFRVDSADCPPERFLTNILLAAYLPGLQKETTQRVVSTSTPPPSNVQPANVRNELLNPIHSPLQTPNSELTTPHSKLISIALKEQLVGGKVNEIRGGAQSVTTVSYFKGNDPSKWKGNIATYEVVDMGEVYKGIGLRLRAYGDNVEKLFTVKPGANPERIRIRLDGIQSSPVLVETHGNASPQSHKETHINASLHDHQSIFEEGKQPPESTFVKGDCAESTFDKGEGRRPGGDVSTEKGARGLSVNEHGELVAETELGPVKFTKPIAYQEIDGKRVDVVVKYNIYSTGSDVEECNDAEMKGGGGQLTPPNSPLFNSSTPQLTYSFTVASYDKTKDLIIDPLLASTYLGGSNADYGNSLALDTSGNVYVTGYTYSTGFPTTSGAYDTSRNGGFYDVFVSKLDGGLTSLLASTYLGGSNADYGNSLALDTSGNVYVTGYTYSTDFPVMSGANDTSFNGGMHDVFVSKMDGGLTSLLASTYLGGSDYDIGNSLALDTSGNVYVMGVTQSTDFPTTSGAYDTSYGGSSDAFVSKLNSGLTSLLASTYLGGSDIDIGRSLALDTSGNVYVAGHTNSTNFPTTSGAYDTSYGGSSDAFVSKLNSGLTSLLASMYLGGSDYDLGYSLTLDTSGDVYVTGNTRSTDFPTTIGAYDASNNGYYDVFISKLNSGLTSLLASTYLGGSSYDYGYDYSLTLNTSGNVYVTGYTKSTDFPTTSGAYDTSSNGGKDVFVSKLDGGLTSLMASTYLGGSDEDSGYSLTLDTSGNVYVTGYTESTDFPTTSGAYDNSYYYSGNDVFVSKLDGNLSAIVECEAESIAATPNKLTVRKNGNGSVTITVKGAGGCPVEGVTVTATINGKGKRLVSVSPGTQETDASGQAVFIINAKDKKGTAVLQFKATGLDEVATAQVKVR